MARYKHIEVGKPVDLAELAAKRRERKVSARQLAIQERDDEIRRAINEASAAPSSQAIATMRAAVNRVLKESESNVQMGVRGTTIYLSKSPIPGGRGRARRGN
ncbi:MAG: hypothetical protein E6H96_04955 [Chloroflexi bacterium]|nr:MAG: hypothetical protein E6H96_04955 [Chloroflexota bacterium]